MTLKQLITLAAPLLLIGLALSYQAAQAAQACQPKTDAFCYGPGLSHKAEAVASISLPKIAVPAWLERQDAGVRTVNYTVASKGNVTIDMDQFRADVAAILNSPFGWSRLGIRFERVEKDGQFIVWMSEDKQVPSFAPGGCDAIVSCTVGNNVIINQTRWLNGSEAWNRAGGSLQDYRRMVLNHETGHWLGHGHRHCEEVGRPAAVMQQQTIDMQGCVPNPWPQAHELYAPKLGIYS